MATAMTTLPTVLNKLTDLPAAFEGKFTAAPKLSTALIKFDNYLPAGPSIWPAMYPPVPPISKLPNPPNIFGSPSSRQVIEARARAAAQQQPRGGYKANLSEVILPGRTVDSNINFLGRHTTGQIDGIPINYK